MAQKVTEFGSFVDSIFYNIFFQSDDELSARYAKEHLSPDLKVRINGKGIPGDSFKDSIVAARAKSSFRVVQVQEILANTDANKASGGSVSHLTVFSVKDKDTGDERHESSLTLVTCALEDGAVVITELTEIHRG
ncbi:uncharacterized protein TrAtP1_007313 [Trichoderma atroviride]|uniref:SnoaL-like domain-containing protein n=1 Tax=Hypocrea atroviridis (strain ATCC 20476 / IMI 206040) TaxID=452589 RepID=G9NG34_HYPAI|nr:uncharacterized protein TRIATDRAFT_314449 [Trichoderma atroviride IMI 206040]EHK50246.1 hypothetical protein TRIATDRAFT_314449 [Trichoderma atroviride IMI 206040]UKZ66133.1 hypothetical protein TrAtP1_007313 [Trichoderma atroviride]